ncbi:MAG: phytanoyl-CoA dioxygenase family protein [Bdellovibrionales bacterium]|nr:phytanoyl-CoA dioxygenase family protein [Bdellovibrionales bacterium]
MSIKSTMDTNGQVSPIPVLNAEEVTLYREKLLSLLDGYKWKLDAVNRHKPHLYLKWANDLGRHPKMLEAVKQVLGPDLLLWYSVIFVKPPQNTGFVPWHQDSTYWAMNKEEGLSAWLALSDVNEANGCVNYIPGSNKGADIKHEINNSKDNMLHRGQMIKDLDTTTAKPIILKPGEMSMHDLRTLHASGPNPSDQPRLGIAFRYIPTSNFPRTLKWLKRGATLVSGEDKFHHFVDDPVPQFDFDPVAMKAYKKSIRVAAIHTLFGDTSRSNLRKVIDTIPILISRKSAEYFKYWKHLKDG